MVTFQQVYDVVVKRYSSTEWSSLPPKEVTIALYQEMRRMDAAAANGDLFNASSTVPSMTARSASSSQHSDL